MHLEHLQTVLPCKTLPRLPLGAQRQRPSMTVQTVLPRLFGGLLCGLLGAQRQRPRMTLRTMCGLQTAALGDDRADVLLRVYCNSKTNIECSVCLTMCVCVFAVPFFCVFHHAQ